MANECTRKHLSALAALAALALACAGPAGAQQLRFNSSTNVLESSLNVYTSGLVQTTSGLYATSVYAREYFRNSSALTGLANSATGNYFYPSASNAWNITGAGSPGQLYFRNGYGGAELGRVYADWSNFGLVNSGGNWMFYSAYNTDKPIFPGGIQIGANGGMSGSALTYGTVMLNQAYGGWYGVRFGSAGSALLLCNTGECGIYLSDIGAWRDRWQRGSAQQLVSSYVTADAVYSYSRPVLTKVVVMTFASQERGYMADYTSCPAGSNATYTYTSTNASSHCCWGSD